MAANASMKRAWTRRSSLLRSAHAGTQSGRGEQLGVGGDHAELLLSGEGPLPPDVPPVVERPEVVVEPAARGLVGRVAGARRDIEEERLVRIGVAEIGDVIDGVVEEILGQVVALLIGGGWWHLVVVVHQGRAELVVLALEEAVPPLEPAPGRPGGAG